MSDGRVRVRGYLRSADTSATLEAVAALGARLVDAQPRGAGLDLELAGAGLRGADPGAAAIDVGNAGTLIRLLPGWLAGQPRGRWALQGDDSIARRPVDRVVHPLRRMGATVDCREGGLPPMVVEGSDLHGIEYELPVASAQVKSCVLLAGLLADSETTVVEPVATRDHTEIMLQSAGAAVRREDGRVTVGPERRLELGEVDVPGGLLLGSVLHHRVDAGPRLGGEVARSGSEPDQDGLPAGARADGRRRGGGAARNRRR